MNPVSLQDWLALLEQRHPVTIDLGLERVAAVYQALGAPRPGRQVITVAGTNGKGSTVAYLSSLLQAQGYSCGSYTSPHLIDYRERAQVTGRMFTEQEWVDAFDIVEAARGEISLSYFEFGTLAALLLLHRTDLDVAVLEVGLGGRLDAVNIVDPDCAVITPIGLDHMDYLGPDLDAIGREKAGILRRGRPAVCGQASPPASILQTADSLDIDLQLLGKDFTADMDQQYWHYHYASLDLQLPLPPLAGEHQVRNLATALTTLFQIFPDLLDSDRHDALTEGIQHTRLPGRLQEWSSRPRILLDVGHNAHAAREIVRYLASQANDKADTESKCVCLLGMLENKPAEQVAEILSETVGHWYCVGLTGARAQSGQQLAERISADHRKVSHYSTVAEGLSQALEEIDDRDTLLIFGSFHTVGESINWLQSSRPDQAASNDA